MKRIILTLGALLAFGIVSAQTDSARTGTTNARPKPERTNTQGNRSVQTPETQRKSDAKAKTEADKDKVEKDRQKSTMDKKRDKTPQSPVPPVPPTNSPTVPPATPPTPPAKP